MIELVVATKNKKKLQEIRELLKDLPLRVTSLEDYPDAPRIVEDGRTFEQNAIKKAATIALCTRKLVLGEDSGLEVKALHNRPGVYSARYAGEDATDLKNNRRLLLELKGVPLKKRGGRYRCAVALADGQGLIGVVSGSCSGTIALEPKGTFGFGYDPLFLIGKFGKTFAQLGPEVKHAMSHRFRALKKARRLILEYLSRNA
ncbi:non-canonical purine NTP pyrophosphatase, RdgB/HAM1 family [Candidatus Velamenicoccus archaeovorus]|uniref:dITP/XTP pyrophosphatase n=1 Tax=Velamenicoccus archaeovorus TaxID=1930593 RepID=A0A410P7I8_VELA1|nr:RdgB/HAM1 family non-canonical purine NTP pyrophosphatase [Candidatus Velamenicoccus archaeovorus]QAT17981.1 non-canonical purine NTP pyrophosphatase, RdgB/HAM1 family [Candidatus Velamenicoccus archaeovorus]